MHERVLSIANVDAVAPDLVLVFCWRCTIVQSVSRCCVCREVDPRTSLIVFSSNFDSPADRDLLNRDRLRRYMAAFDRATSVVKTRAGLYACQVSNDFGTFGGAPNGGYVVALMLRALEVCLSKAYSTRLTHCFA